MTNTRTVRTRFAPSPTGYLHIGGARTALFNYLFAKHHGGKFLLRIEDTDFARSTEEAKNAILRSMEWLGLEYDEEIIYQSQRAARHQEIANMMLKDGSAYYCFSSQEDIANLRESAHKAGEHFIFHSPWRDEDPKNYPTNQQPVVRLKAPRTGETIVGDLVQGKVKVQNSHLDDMVLLRSDGTPTYMLAVVVDDHDMGITHIIRGDDHLNNASRQQLIYSSLGWEIPKMAHIPLIHGPDGAKLSKRHGALGVENYKEMGYLPAALNNYLLRLGWSHGNDEIISKEQAIKWFDIDGLGKSPARIDFDKMKHINAHYLRIMDNNELANIIFNYYEKSLAQESKNYILKGIDAMKPRCELLTDIFDLAKIFIIDGKFVRNEEASALINQCDKNLIERIRKSINEITDFNKHIIQSTLKLIAEEQDLKMGDLMKYVRAFITGRLNSPSVFEIMEILGKQHSLKRLEL